MSAAPTVAPVALFEEIAAVANQLNELLYRIEEKQFMDLVTAAQCMVRSIGQLADFGADALHGTVACGDIGWWLPPDAVTVNEPATAATAEGGAA